VPWNKADAKRHTKKASGASGGSLAELWARVANERLRKGASEGSAVRQANYVVKRARGRG